MKARITQWVSNSECSQELDVKPKVKKPKHHDIPGNLVCASCWDKGQFKN